MTRRRHDQYFTPKSACGVLRKHWDGWDVVTDAGIGCDSILAEYWEVVLEPVRVADYFVPIPQCELLDHSKSWFRTVLRYQSTQAEKANDIYYRDTYPIGKQPEGSVMVPGSEKEVTE